MPVIEHWCWDDEDTARPPYIQIYSGDGCLACLHYASPAERELHVAFAQKAVALHAEVERLRVQRDDARSTLAQAYDTVNVLEAVLTQAYATISELGAEGARLRAAADSAWTNGHAAGYAEGVAWAQDRAR